MADKYPEHEKLSKIKDQSQTIGEFIDWLMGGFEGSPGLQICEYHEGTYGAAALIADALACKETDREYDPSGYIPVADPMALLVRYFGIDQEKIDAEKREMLAALRA